MEARVLKTADLTTVSGRRSWLDRTSPSLMKLVYCRLDWLSYSQSTASQEHICLKKCSLIILAQGWRYSSSNAKTENLYDKSRGLWTICCFMGWQRLRPKSGYVGGASARYLGWTVAITWPSSTFMAAHAVPPNIRTFSEYLELIVEILPRVAEI